MNTQLNGELTRQDAETMTADRQAEGGAPPPTDTTPAPAPEAARERAPHKPEPVAWDATHTDLEASHHDHARSLGETVGEAARAEEAEAAKCDALRTTLKRAWSALRGLGGDSEGLWFGAYLALSVLVVIAEVASGVATAWLITVPPAVRALLMVAFITFPPLSAIALGECLRPMRFRRPLEMQYRVGAGLLTAFSAMYLTTIYAIRSASVNLTGDAPLIAGPLEATALCVIAAAGYLLAIVGAMTRESLQRFVLTMEIRQLKRSLKVHVSRLARARLDHARAVRSAADDDHPLSDVPGSTPPERRSGGTAAATAVVALALLAGISPDAASAAPGPRCPDSLTWVRTAIPADSRLTVLVTTQPGSDAQRALDRAMAKSVIGCAGTRTAVTVRAITESALTDAPVWQGITPDDAPSADPYGPVRGRGFIAQSDDAVDRAMAAAPAATLLQSDILGALQASGHDWSVAPKGSARVAWIVAPGYVQSRYMNVYQYKQNAAAKMDETLRRLRRDGTLPDLVGVNVYLVGLTLGAAGMDTNGADLNGVCAFWRAVITAAKGELKLCTGALPGISREMVDIRR